MCVISAPCAYLAQPYSTTLVPPGFHHPFVGLSVSHKTETGDLNSFCKAVRVTTEPGGRARNPRSPSPSPSPICRGSGMGVPSPICRGSVLVPESIPIPIPDLPESGSRALSTIEYCKGIEFRLPQCLTLRSIVQPIKLINLRRPAMSDDAVDYSGTSDSSGSTVRD